jgi:hypothetical protein
MKLNYTGPQQDVFFPSRQTKFTIVTKGRRVGLTRGAAQAYIEYALTNSWRLLWGETIYSNVQRYFDLYFKPILKELPRGSWEWSPRMMQLLINNSLIDFRSADNPEMWEGFGYNVIFLNEAGIILRNPDLYKKTVLPMLMDYEGSKLIAAGVPKGKKIKDGRPHPFFELWQKAELDSINYVKHRYSSYSNPFLNSSDIKEIEDVLDEQTKMQEIYGEFIDTTDNPYLYAFDSGTHVSKQYKPNEAMPIWFSFDFNVEPNSCIVGQQPDHTSGVTFDEVSVKGSTEEVCNVLLAKYAHWLNKGMVFVTGDATGKNRNAMTGELTNYILIKRILNLRDYNLKLKTVNSPLKASRIVCNSILSKGNVLITENCKQTITDCQIANVDGSGELIKDSGLHKLDCQRYLWEAWFPDFLKSGYKYTKQQPIKLSRIEDRMQTINAGTGALNRK